MPRELERMVAAIKRSGGAKNTYAVARAKLGTDAQIKARRKNKKNRHRTIMEG